ncbi:putative outer membrane starch-binding protein [Dyadobacter jejuensis]|uniref:Putative outer membrane starch-binding protein n=1 Tax=Dyadobacter jejuensis TaxID=1082580 RepID=A0A316AL88_9BACT|nr:RagB/SusD family nutrient uptake outer membrane protein [Dyadobacter jejuensis]PWJ58019.1 putative outer membrane starch-binding protein [Dyadobacter jejuensis]
MKVNQKYSRIIWKSWLLGATFLTMVACEEKLDLTPYGQPVEQTFYKTEQDAIQAINAAYYPLREIGQGWRNDLVVGDIGTDDAIKGGVNVEDNGGLLEKETYRLTSANATLALRWKANYQGIYYANIVLDKVPSIDMSEDLKKRILGEAHFLRAFYHFDLVKLYGGVPLGDKILPIDGKFAKASKEEIYAFVEAEFNLAKENLPLKSKNVGVNKGRADKGAAIGMMVRVSAYLNKMDKVRQYAEELFALNEYSLDPDFGAIYQPTGEWGPGSIFEINYYPSNDPGWLQGQGNLTATAAGPRTIGGWGFGQLKQDLLDEFETGDPRKEASTYLVGGQAYGTGIFNRKYSYTPYSKYEYAKVGSIPTNGPHNYRILRLADVYLMYAEAQYALGNETVAREYVNKVRTRARGDQPASVLPNLAASVSGQDLIDAIYHERRVELAGEGLRYWDLIRTGRAEKVLGPLGFKKGLNEVFPLPIADIILSDGVLVQNPGYN